MQKCSKKRNKMDCSDLESHTSDKFVSEDEYVSIILSSFGYDEINQSIKLKFVNIIKRWTQFITQDFEKKGKKYPIHNYLHQLYPNYWYIYNRYYVSKRRSSKGLNNIDKINETELTDIDSIDDPTNELDQQNNKNECELSIANHFKFMNKRSMLLDNDYYSISRKCIHSLGNSDGFLTDHLHIKSSHVIVQFSNLFLFYNLCFQFSLCSNVYTIQEDSLEKQLNDWFISVTQYNVESIDINDTIMKQMRQLKKKRTVKSEQPPSNDDQDEYHFLQSML